MTPEELRTEQNAITRPVVAASASILGRLPVKALTPQQWVQLVAILFPTVNRARSRGVDLAAAFYASQNPKGTHPDLEPPPYDAAMLAKALRTFVEPRIGDEDTHAAAVTLGSAAVGRHVEQAGREWVALATASDGVKYARMDPLGETCAFCQLLVSRGPAYLSQTSGNFRSHPGCTCVAVPVFDTNDWPGREQYEAAEALYAQATEGTSGKESIRAFRRAVEAGQTGDSARPERDADAPEPAPRVRAPEDLSDEEMDDALAEAIDAEDWDRFEALEAETNARQEAAEKRARESASRSERRRQQKAREREAQLDTMMELVDSGVSEADAYAEAYGVSTDQAERTFAIQSLRSAGYKGKSFEALARDSYADHCARQWLDAENWTRGAMLTKEAMRLGIDDRGLFSGPVSRARKYASEELLGYWEEHPRLTFDEWVATLLGDASGAQSARKAGEVSRDR